MASTRGPRHRAGNKGARVKGGRDFSRLEVTALADPHRRKESEMRAYHSAGAWIV